MRYLLVILSIVSVMSAAELLTNGNFEQDLSVGWLQSLYGGYAAVNRGTAYEPDPDYEAQAADSFGGYAELYQIADIPSTNIQFSAKAKLYAYDNNADTLCYAGVAVIVAYLNQSGVALGETRICQFSAPCPWSNTSTCHLIIVSNSNWNNYSFNVATELGNLPGVNPANVKKIKVSLYAVTSHTC